MIKERLCRDDHVRHRHRGRRHGADVLPALPVKGDVVIANWRRRGDALRDAGRQAPDTDQPIEVVRAALHAYTEDLTPDNESSRVNARTIWANRPLAVLLLDVVINLEHDIATELARRQGRSAEDLHVRITANASIGVLRAAIRGAFVSDRLRLPDQGHRLRAGLDRTALCACHCAEHAIETVIPNEGGPVGRALHGDHRSSLRHGCRFAGRGRTVVDIDAGAFGRCSTRPTRRTVESINVPDSTRAVSNRRRRRASSLTAESRAHRRLRRSIIIATAW